MQENMQIMQLCNTNTEKKKKSTATVFWELKKKIISRHINTPDS